MTALVKLLFLADYEHYRRHLRSITGKRYVALPNGPALDRYKEEFEQLVDNGYLKLIKVPVIGLAEPKLEFVPQVDPDESVFSESELSVLREVIQRHGGKTGTELVAFTHSSGPWPFVWEPSEPGRSIPPVAFRWLDNLPDDEDAAAARELIAQPEVAATIREVSK